MHNNIKISSQQPISHSEINVEKISLCIIIIVCSLIQKAVKVNNFIWRLRIEWVHFLHIIYSSKKFSCKCRCDYKSFRSVFYVYISEKWCLTFVCVCPIEERFLAIIGQPNEIASSSGLAAPRSNMSFQRPEKRSYIRTSFCLCMVMFVTGYVEDRRGQFHSDFEKKQTQRLVQSHLEKFSIPLDL